MKIHTSIIEIHADSEVIINNYNHVWKIPVDSFTRNEKRILRSIFVQTHVQVQWILFTFWHSTGYRHNPGISKKRSRVKNFNEWFTENSLPLTKTGIVFSSRVVLKCYKTIGHFYFDETTDSNWQWTFEKNYELPFHTGDNLFSQDSRFYPPLYNWICFNLTLKNSFNILLLSWAQINVTWTTQNYI